MLSLSAIQAMSGVVPAKIAASFTMAELAVLSHAVAKRD